MANQQAMSDEEAQLRRRARRRLIGAVTLVTVMVVTLPMVLDGEQKQSGQDIAINIPAPAASGDFSSKIVPVPEQAKSDSAPAPQTEKPAPAAVPDKVTSAPQPEKLEPAAAAAEKVAAAKPEQAAPKKTAEAKAEMVPAKKEEKPADKPKEATDKAKETKPAEAQHANGSHIILLGAFLSEANAKQRQAKLKEIGIKFYLEKIKSPAGEKTAVRAGPYPSRQDAERVLAKLKAAGIMDGIVAEKKG